MKGKEFNPKTALTLRAQRVYGSRQKRYGLGPIWQHGNLGEVWHAMLQNHWNMELPPLPAHMVLLMMAANKNQRMALDTGFHEDNYIDYEIYTKLAQHAASGGKETHDVKKRRPTTLRKVNGEPVGIRRRASRSKLRVLPDL